MTGEFPQRNFGEFGDPQKNNTVVVGVKFEAEGQAGPGKISYEMTAGVEGKIGGGKASGIAYTKGETSIVAGTGVLVIAKASIFNWHLKR